LIKQNQSEQSRTLSEFKSFGKQLTILIIIK